MYSIIIHYSNYDDFCLLTECCIKVQNRYVSSLYVIVSLHKKDKRPVKNLRTDVQV